MTVTVCVVVYIYLEVLQYIVAAASYVSHLAAVGRVGEVDAISVCRAISNCTVGTVILHLQVGEDRLLFPNADLILLAN